MLNQRNVTVVALGFCVFAACLLTTPVWAQSVTAKDAWVRGTVAGQMATGAFMELKASENAALLSVSSPVAGTVEVHEMSMDKGVMKMRAVPKLELPAGKAITLKPGGYHIMLMDLKQPLKKGDSVPLTLKVESKDKKLSTLDVKAEVRDLTAPPAMEHKH